MVATTSRALVHDEIEESQTDIVRHLRKEGFAVETLPPEECPINWVRHVGVDICMIGGGFRSMDAFEIARRLRHETACGVIFLGRRNDEMDAVLALEMGADDFVAKPVRLRELAARARSVRRRTKITPPLKGGERPLPDGYLRRIDDIEMCGVQRTVRVAGDEIKLTPLEFDVLMAFAVNVNKVLSRQAIIEKVRGKHWAINDRAVDGVIYSLRGKMFPDGSGAQRIRTLHGRGYMLVQSGASSEA
ncbi:MAG: response regulator [Alphaproteobacteria bacterium]|jgi:DNA-binding response OmpR family regulator|nr:response regulator [Alphaproteobacteria bacterium]